MGTAEQLVSHVERHRTTFRSWSRQSVCVQYGTRSKIISFLSDGVQDIARITEAAKRAFAGDLLTSKIEFQSFDKLFDEWIDVDDAEPVDDLKKLRLVCHVGRQMGNFTWPQVVASHR